MYIFAYLGMNQIIIILVLVLLVFGPQKVPEIGRQIGGALRDLKKMSNDVQQAFDIDEHLSYDRYEPPTYEYHPPIETTHTPLDQYGLPVAEEHPALEGHVTEVETAAVASDVVTEEAHPVTEAVAASDKAVEAPKTDVSAAETHSA